MKGVNKDRLAYWITYPEEIEAEEIVQLEEVSVKYPYFQLAYLLQVSAKVRHEASDLAGVISKASAYALNRSVLRRIVENDLNLNKGFDRSKQDFEQVTPQEPAVEKVESPSEELPEHMENLTIIEEPLKSEAEKLEEAIAFRKLQKQIIDQFIKNDPKIRPVNDFLSDSANHSDLAQQARQPLNSGSLATESFAKILEKQGKFSQSKGIYEKLILKNPEKKNYFAEKIKELSEKLKD